MYIGPRTNTCFHVVLCVFSFIYDTYRSTDISNSLLTAAIFGKLKVVIHSMLGTQRDNISRARTPMLFLYDFN
jgi:hypothetical protein